MSKLIYEVEGVRGRVLKLYDRKCVIITKKTIGSLMTGNITDGEKTIYLCDVVGVQFKKSGALIGYLQFETPSMQMNNKDSNMFSENTFTFEDGKNGVTNEIMEAVYNYITDRIEEIKYGVTITNGEPCFDGSNTKSEETTRHSAETTPEPQNKMTKKAVRCECGALSDGLYCVVCGRKIIYQAVEDTQEKEQLDEATPKVDKVSLSYKCKCGERYYGDVCPNCGRTRE